MRMDSFDCSLASRITFKLGLCAIVSLTFLMISSIQSGEAQDWSGIRIQAKDSVLFLKTVVRNRDGTNEHIADTASGFIISKQGHFLTAAHVLQQADTNIEVVYFASIGPGDNRQFELNLIKSDPDLDIALFQLPPSQVWTPLKLASSSGVSDDARLFVLGFPKRADLSSGEGIVRNRFAKSGRFETSLPLNYGDSGSPVFDIAGCVIGMAEGGYDDANLITYVIPSDFFGPLVSLAGQNIGAGAGNAPAAGAYSPNTRGFPYSFTVDSEDQREFEQIVCVGESEHIQHVYVSIGSQNGDGTHLISALPLKDRPNCVSLRVYVAGNGVDRIFGIIVNHRGRGWLSGLVNISTASSILCSGPV
jgi:Trypsin-like peptidase domain